MSLKSLAIAALRRDTPRDGSRPARAESSETTGHRRLKPLDYAAIYAALGSDIGTSADFVAIRTHAERNGPGVVAEVAWLDRRCDDLEHAGADEATYRAAVLLMVARICELRRWHSGTTLPPASRQLAVETYVPVTGPALLPDGTVVDDVGGFIGRLMSAVDHALAYPAVASEAVLDVYVGQLASLGIRARVTVIQ